MAERLGKQRGADLTGERRAAAGAPEITPGRDTVVRRSAVVGRQFFAERLWPSAGIWLVGMGLAGTAGLAFYPAAGVPGVTVAVVAGAAVVVAVMLWWSATVRVVEVTPSGPDDAATQPWLQAGAARIPLAALGDARALSAAQWSTALGVGADARSYHFVRGWIPIGVHVDVTDHRDPVPSWLISSRRPDDLVAAIQQAKSAWAAPANPDP